MPLPAQPTALKPPPAPDANPAVAPTTPAAAETPFSVEPPTYPPPLLGRRSIDARAPDPATPVVEPSFGIGPDVEPAADDLPSWLSERLRDDAERDAKRERNHRWTRRALLGSGIALVLAVAAAAAAWFVQDSRVEGALTALAHTAPASQAAPARADAGAQARLGTDARAASTPAQPAQPPADAQTAPAASSSGTSSANAPANPPENPAPDPAANQEVETDPPAKPAARQRPARHRSASAAAAGTASGAAAKTTAARAKAADESSPTHRREETLLQCRALGYDERQCDRRGCEMTRFGLACRG
jgi:hypothetical protein